MNRSLWCVWFLSTGLAACGGDRAGPADGGEDGLGFARPEVGDPVLAEELAEVTELYLDLLDRRRFFEIVDERAHGWPESDPAGIYWYATWWSGVRVLRQGSAVSFVHSMDGADNNAMRTAPLLEAAGFAWHLWQRPEHLLLVRRLTRGFTSWILAMERSGVPESRSLMTRAHYAEPILSRDGGREVFIDTGQNRPGLDTGASAYVHLVDNPYWPDIWVKNKRSKDDAGHIMRAVALLELLPVLETAPGLVEDLDLLRQRFRLWCQRVEEDGWAIATYDKDGQVWIPGDELAHFLSLENAECVGMLPLRLYGHGDPGTLDCGDGISSMDELISLKPSNAQMLRAYHEAAVAQAQLAGQGELARRLLGGLARRVDGTLDALLGPTPPAAPSPEDMAELLSESLAVGLPLTWREVRYLHERLREAHGRYLDPAGDLAYQVFDPATPDGEYPFEPPGGGIAFRDLGLLLADCASPLRNPTSKPLLDCERVRARFAE